MKYHRAAQRAAKRQRLSSCNDDDDDQQYWADLAAPTTSSAKLTVKHPSGVAGTSTIDYGISESGILLAVCLQDITIATRETEDMAPREV